MGNLVLSFIEILAPLGLRVRYKAFSVRGILTESGSNTYLFDFEKTTDYHAFWKTIFLKLRRFDNAK